MSLAFWMLGIILIYLNTQHPTPIIVVAGVMTSALLVGGYSTHPGTGRASALFMLVLWGGSLAGLSALQPAVLSGVTTLATAPFSPSATDGQRIAGTAMVIALGTALLWLSLGLAGCEVRLPLGLLLTPLAAAIVAILGPGAAGLSLWPALALLLVSLSFGQWVLRLSVGKSESDGPLSWLVAIAIGSGTISLVWLALGSLRLFTPLGLALVTLAILSLAWRDGWRLGRAVLRTRRWITSPVAMRQNAAPLAIGTLLGGLLLMTLMAALAPDLGSDSVNNHLAVAARFAQQGSTDPIAETHLSYWHLPIQVLYAGLIAWSGPIAAKALHFCYGVLAAAGAAALATHITGGYGPGLVAASIFAVSSLVWWTAATGYVDLAVTFYSLAIMCTLVRWQETGHRGWLVAAGLVTGIAVPSKLTSLVFAGIVVLAIIAREYRCLRALGLSLATAGVPTLAMWAPWLLRSYLLSGNPIFPWLNQFFQSPQVELQAVYAAVPFGVEKTFTGLLSLPFAITFRPGLFVETGELGLHLLALSPLLLFLVRVRPISPSVTLLSAASTIFIAAWVYGMYQNLRYLLPALPLFAVLLAIGYHHATSQRKGTLLSYSLVATLFVTVVANILNPSYWWSRLVSGSALPYNVVLGRQTPDGFLHAFVPGFGALQYLNATYHGHAQIWAPFFGNRLYSDAPIFFNDNYTVLPVRTKLAAIERERDARTAYHALRELGFTHILVNTAVQPIWLPESERPAYLRPDFLDRFAVLEYADKGMPLYRLLPAEREPSPRAEVSLLRDGGFERIILGAPGDWEALGQPRWDISGEMARTGRVAVAVDAGNRLRAGPFPAVAGHTYRLRVYARTEDPDATGSFEIQFLTSTRQPLPGTWLPYIPDRTYRPFDFLATAPDGTQYVQIALGGSTSQRWIWIDDVSLVELDLERPSQQQ